jgi:hypothetical protein
MLRFLSCSSRLLRQFPFTIAIIALPLTVAGCAPGGVAGQITPLPPGYAETVNAARPTQRRPDNAASATPGEATPTFMVSASPLPTLPTATPLTTQLPPGSARQIALATDTALQPTPRARLDFAGDPVAIKFDEFYEGYNIRTGLVLSDKLVSLDGKRVVMEGYMAPPLKPELDYFVLTRIQLQFCPFCSTAADWPDDIALVYMPDGEVIMPIRDPIRIVGQIEVGQSIDAETGMFSLVRLFAERVDVLK